MIKLQRLNNCPVAKPNLEGQESEPDIIHLVVGKTYFVGRDGCDIVCKGDGSVSRKHAKLEVVHPPGNTEIVALKPHVVLEDLGAKHGTFVNDGIEKNIRINCYEPELLPIGSRVSFGKQWNVFTVEYSPLVICTSSLAPDSLGPLKETTRLLGGHFLNYFTQDCTHLVMDALTSTTKFLLALMTLKPIVTTKYFDDLLEYFQNNLDANQKPKEIDYIPPADEPMMLGNEIKCLVDERRKCLFKGKYFLFSNSSTLKNLEEIIKLGKGQVGLLTDEEVSIRKLQDANTLLVVADTEDITTFSSEKKTALDVYLQKKPRPIGVWEIVLGIFYLDLITYCNPQKLPPTRIKKPETTVQGVKVDPQFQPSNVVPPLQNNKRKLENSNTLDTVNKCKREKSNTADTVNKLRLEKSNTADTVNKLRLEKSNTADTVNKLRLENSNKADTVSKRKLGNSNTADTAKSMKFDIPCQILIKKEPDESGNEIPEKSVSE